MILRIYLSQLFCLYCFCYFYQFQWISSAIQMVLILFIVYSINSMSRATTRKARCETDVETTFDRVMRIKCHSNQPILEKMSRQIKFINPYSKITFRPYAKTLINFQKPHQIMLLPKRHHKVASEIKIMPFVQPQEFILQKYKLDRVIGKGMSSTIYIGFIQQTDKKVAIKKMAQDPRIKNKQVSILKLFNHGNILKLIDHYYTVENGRRFLCIVTELYHCDLFHFIREQRRRINEDMIKNFAYHILRGVQQMHKKCIVHRDLKSSNILIDMEGNSAIICDFGCAKQLSFGQTASGQYCPVSYRAPELLFGSSSYSFSSDMWAFGCILLEMATSSLPFKARSNLELILQIINLLGTPSLSQIYQINQDYDERQYHILPKARGKGIKNVYQLDKSLSDLLQKIFVYSPSQRITASDALKHKYFANVAIDRQMSNSSCLSKFEDKSQIFITPSQKKDYSNLNTVATIEDEPSKELKKKIDSRLRSSSQLRLNKQGINIPLKINRKLQF